MSVDEEDIAGIFEPQPLPYKIHESAITQRIHNIYISEDIGEPNRYTSLIELLRLAQPTDTIYIYLNTHGGNVNTGVQILHAMKDSYARIVTVLDGVVCSMGALLFLAANEFIVHDYSQLMFHNYSGGVFGKGHEQIANLNATTEWYTNMMVDICSPFLTEKELSDVINGHDLWLNADNVRERLEHVTQTTIAELEQHQLEIEAEEEAIILKRISTREKKEARRKLKTSSSVPAKN